MTTTSRPSVQDTAQTQLDDQFDRPRDTRADIVVKGRNVEVPDHFRIYVSEKLSRLERFDPSIFLFDVELFHERNRRQRKNCQRVEITAREKATAIPALRSCTRPWPSSTTVTAIPGTPMSRAATSQRSASMPTYSPFSKS